MEQLDLTCPTTGALCPGKVVLGQLIQKAEAVQSRPSELATPPVLSPQDAQGFRDQKRTTLSERGKALRRDLAATCSGTVCAPLVESATRYMLDGFSYTEALQFPGAHTSPS